MGDPRRLRNKSERPKKLWEVDRIEEERGLVETYGLKNMRELWMATAELKKYRREARRLLSISEEERREDSKKILTKLVKLGILKDTSVIDDVLSLEVKDILERRLQTIVMRKGLARTMAQSRQLITHGYISVNSRTVNRPNHTITLEDNVGYAKQIDISVKTAEPTAAPATPSAAPASTEKVATS
ncbi:MAG: 30S ribosomal protein S4 [Candidatus Bilamarchaeum sp.]|jgi:small subunit ribosomal protein S4